MPADEFNPQDDDLALPAIPDPDRPADEAEPLTPEQPDPLLTQKPSDTGGDLQFGKEVEALKEADALPAAPPAPELSVPEIGRPDTSGGPEAGFTDDVNRMLEADAPTPLKAGPAAREAAGGPRQEPAVPTNYREFQEAVAGLKRHDGRPWDSRAVANMYRRQRELGVDNGLEPPAGMEAMDLFERESQQGFHQGERQMLNQQANLFGLLTQKSVEHSQTLTQLRNVLIRNRH